MKFANTAVATLALLDASVSAAAVAIPETHISTYQPRSEEQSQSSSRYIDDLWKRRGGGGSGGRGGGSSGSGSSSSGSSSSGTGSTGSSSSGSGSTGSTGGSSSSGASTGATGAGRGSTGSTSGGRTTTGSGVRPAYGGGAYYGGGTTVPYKSGARSTGGLLPLSVGAFALTALVFWPGIWYHPAYLYEYNNDWNYHNATTGKNESKPVTCACDQEAECGCDDNNNQTYVDSVMGDGTYNGLNKSLVTVANVNGTDTILLNGTLDNGTTASGGDESANASLGMGMKAMREAMGWWPVFVSAGVIALMA